MPVIEPPASARNLTPSSIALPSPLSTVVGALDEFQILQGQVAGTILTLTPLPGVSMLPLSSTARLKSVIEPTVLGVHTKLQLERPIAGCQVLPPSPENSTPATTPPESLANPVTVMLFPALKVELFVGAVMTEAGGIVSVEA